VVCHQYVHEAVIHMAISSWARLVPWRRDETLPWAHVPATQQTTEPTALVLRSSHFPKIIIYVYMLFDHQDVAILVNATPSQAAV
jgi:hypothetical protein